MNKKYIIEVAANKSSLEKLKDDLSTALQKPFDESAKGGRVKGLTRSEKAAIKNDLATLFGVAEYQADALRNMVQAATQGLTDQKSVDAMKNQLKETLEFTNGIMQKMQQIGDASDWMKQGVTFVDDFSKMQNELKETQEVVKGLEKHVNSLTKTFGKFKDAFASNNSEAFLKRFGNSTRSEAESLARAYKELERIENTRNKKLSEAMARGKAEDYDYTGISVQEIQDEYKTTIEIIEDANREIERLRKKYKGRTADLYNDSEYHEQIQIITGEIKRLEHMPGLNMDDVGKDLKATLKEATDSVKSVGNEIQNIVKKLQGKGLELSIILPDATSSEFASKIQTFIDNATKQFKKKPIEISVGMVSPFKEKKGEDTIANLTSNACSSAALTKCFLAFKFRSLSFKAVLAIFTNDLIKCLISSP